MIVPPTTCQAHVQVRAVVRIADVVCHPRIDEPADYAIGPDGQTTLSILSK